MNNYSLPHLPRLFKELSSGRHICLKDGALFYALIDEYPKYVAFFEALGFVLIRHARDFFYFEQDGKANTVLTKQMSLFVFLLIDHLDRTEAELETVLLSQRFTLANLPHLKTTRSTELMAEVNIRDEVGLLKVLEGLNHYGFATLYNKDSFEFNSPIYRFFDICVDALSETTTSTCDTEDRELI